MKGHVNLKRKVLLLCLIIISTSCTTAKYYKRKESVSQNQLYVISKLQNRIYDAENEILNKDRAYKSVVLRASILIDSYIDEKIKNLTNRTLLKGEKFLYLEKSDMNIIEIFTIEDENYIFCSFNIAKLNSKIMKLKIQEKQAEEKEILAQQNAKEKIPDDDVKKSVDDEELENNESDTVQKESVGN